MASKENGEEIEQILISDKMKKYSSFILDDNIKTDVEMNNVLKKHLEDYQCGFDTKEENVRILNFISYLFGGNAMEKKLILLPKKQIL